MFYVTNFLILQKTYFVVIGESLNGVTNIVEVFIVGVEVATGPICYNK